MPQRRELGRPVVGPAAGFDADQAGLQAREERCDLVTLELLAKNRNAAFVDAMSLEHILGQIQTNGLDLHELPPESGFSLDA